jgi:hypothetical protein
MLVAMPTAMPELPFRAGWAPWPDSTTGFQGVVVVGAEVDGVLVDVAQKFAGQLGHAHFGVTHGRRGVAVDGAEVALPVHQRVAHGEFLGQAHQGVVHGGVAVRVVLADDVADHAGGLLVGAVVAVPSSCMANRMRRCTGFKPSRTSGMARPTMTESEYSR